MNEQQLFLNNATTAGGGVYIFNNATFTLENGGIFLNSAEGGGGVYVNNGTFGRWLYRK